MKLCWSSIFGLRNTIRPAAVSCSVSTFAVIALAAVVPTIVVDSVDGQVWSRSFAHVSKECLKRVSPVFTDVDSAPPVVGVCLCCRKVTPIDHRVPDAVNTRSAHSVFEVAFTSDNPGEASTASCSPSYSVTRDCRCSSAVTLGKPSRYPFSFLVDSLDNKKPSNTMPREVLKRFRRAAVLRAPSDFSVEQMAGKNRLLSTAVTSAYPTYSTCAIISAQDCQKSKPLPCDILEILRCSGTLRISHDASPESRVVRADLAHQRLAGSFILQDCRTKRNMGCWGCTVTTEPNA